MKSILMFDTGVATLNTGDEIINYSIKKIGLKFMMVII